MANQHFAVFLVSQALPAGMDGSEVEVDDALYYRFHTPPLVPDQATFDFDEQSGQYYPLQYVNYYVVMEVHEGTVVTELSPEWAVVFNSQPELILSVVDHLLEEESSQVADTSTSSQELESDALTEEFQALLDARAPEVVDGDYDPAVVSELELARVLAVIRQQLGKRDEVYCLGVFSLEEVTPDEVG